MVIPEVQMPTVTQPSSRLTTEGTFCGMKNEDQNPPTRHQQLRMKSTNHEQLPSFHLQPHTTNQHHRLLKTRRKRSTSLNQQKVAIR